MPLPRLGHRILPRSVEVLGDTVNQIVRLCLAKFPALLGEGSLLHRRALETTVRVLDDADRISFPTRALRLSAKECRFHVSEFNLGLLIGNREAIMQKRYKGGGNKGEK